MSARSAVLDLRCSLIFAGSSSLFGVAVLVRRLAECPLVLISNMPPPFGCWRERGGGALVDRRLWCIARSLDIADSQQDGANGADCDTDSYIGGGLEDPLVVRGPRLFQHCRLLQVADGRSKYGNIFGEFLCGLPLSKT